MTFPFNSPNNLSEISFIAGADQELVFNVFTSGCTLVDISSASIVWGLSPYGPSGTAVLQKQGYATGSPVNQFMVHLTSADTQSLYGKYIQQYSLTDSSGSVFKPSQGLVNITRGMSYPPAFDLPT